MEPTVGRIVHYYPPESVEPGMPLWPPGPYAAIVTRVHNPSKVDLTVFGPPGTPEATRAANVIGSETQRSKGERWEWPPRT